MDPRLIVPPYSSFTALLLGCTILGLNSCTPIRQTLYMEHRLFVRVPGKIPKGPVAVSDGWHFRHVLQGPHQKTPEAQWYVAWRDDGRDRLPSFVKSQAWTKAIELAPELADATFQSLGAYPQVVEPGLVFKEKEQWTKRILKKIRKSEDTPEVEIEALPSAAWASSPADSDGMHDPFWYQDDDHSQLESARKMVKSKTGGAGKGIRIGFLDTGFDNRHVGLPRHLIDEADGEAVQALKRETDIPGPHGKARLTPGQTLDTGHATGTMGILAGRKVMAVDRYYKNGKPYTRERLVEVGGAPDAEIVAVRVAPWVASLSTANLAYGIDYASRVKKCDVISMSHGGSASMMWTDAVNAAYDRGTAMFAATGDFAALPLPYLNRLGLVVPSSTVYPASFRRVIGVAGATEDHKSYGKLDWRRGGAMLSHPDTWLSLWMRGSYGADSVRRSLINGRESSEHEKTDIVQRTRLNELRANPIAGYSPNVPWLSAGKPDAQGPVDRIDLNGGGTSTSAPQAAAAAANWLAYHRQEIEKSGGWNDWRKAEATYLAMVHSASRPWASDEKNPNNQKPDMMLGSGMLRAKDMLGVSYQQALATQGTTLNSPYQWGRDPKNPDVYPASGGSPRDFYDSQRSFFTAVFAFNRNSPTSKRIRQSADVRLGTGSVHTKRQSRQLALTDLYFNMLLIRQFQYGYQPVKDKEVNVSDRMFNLLVPDDAALQKQAEKLAMGEKAGRRKSHSK